jgi:hypothetical protein
VPDPAAPPYRFPNPSGKSSPIPGFIRPRDPLSGRYRAQEATNRSSREDAHVQADLGDDHLARRKQALRGLPGGPLIHQLDDA